MKKLVNLWNEIGMLAKTPRSGFAFLGSGKQSVAEHSFRMTLLAYTLAVEASIPVNLEKLLLMSLVHDLPEARIGDLNYVNKRYVQADEGKVIEQIKGYGKSGQKISEILEEYNQGKSIESQLAHDADQLELMLVLKEEHEKGNPQAMVWFERGCRRLKTEIALGLAETIRNTPSNSWWFE